MTPILLDTGALIALERRRQRMGTLVRLARTDRVPVLVPSICVAEWWRGRTDDRERILRAVVVVHTDDALVAGAGRALAEVRDAGVVDALVMATAARHGAVVFTSDLDDLLRLQQVFRAVRVLAV